MALLPSLRQKKRYVLFEIISDQEFKSSEVEAAAILAIKEFIGQLGLAKSSPVFIKELYTGQRFVLKVNHLFVKEIISALMLVKEIGKSAVAIKSVTTSGILKKVSR